MFTQTRMCHLFCLAESIDVVSMERSKLFNFESNPAKDMSIYCGEHDVFIFANGTIICWPEKDTEDFSYLKQFSPFFSLPLEKTIHEEIPYIYDESKKTTLLPSEELNDDMIILNHNDKMLKLAISYGLSRSVKLKYLEHILEAIINKYAPLAKALSHKGSLKISRRGILKIIGELMTTKSDLNLANNFSYIPTFFWQKSQLQF